MVKKIILIILFSVMGLFGQNTIRSPYYYQFSTILALPFGTAADSSIITTSDTLPCGYTIRSFTIDTVIVVSYGTPDLTFQLYHSGSTATFASAQTVDEAVEKYSTFNDATVTEGRIYVIPVVITTKPQKLSLQIIGHY